MGGAFTACGKRRSMRKISAESMICVVFYYANIAIRLIQSSWCARVEIAFPLITYEEAMAPSTTPAPYRDAFIRYLRKDTPIALTLKALKETHPSKLYIWRTRGDANVRPSHAANNGKVFSWDSPPATGHPGEDYGCRCIAEAYTFEKRESATQTLSSIVDEGLNRWEWIDFFTHFFFAEGQSVTLSDIGHLREIIHVAEFDHFIYQKVNQQILEIVRNNGIGNIKYDFNRSYNFKPVSYPHGNATINGIFNGNAILEGGYIIISGTMTYVFKDLFTDIFRLRDRVFGNTSNPEAVSELWRTISDANGTPFVIKGTWKTDVRIVTRR